MRLPNVIEHLRTLRNLTRSRFALQEVKERVHRQGISQTDATSRIDMLETEKRDLHETVKDLKASNVALEQSLERTMGQMTRELVRLNGIMDAQRRSYVEVTRQLAANPTKMRKAGGDEANEDPLLGIFYREFEDRYRGSREEILLRLREYIGHIQFLAEHDKNALRIVDLGCGRGEWLEVLREEGFTATGVDLNEAQAEAARQLDLHVEIADAVSWLSRQKERSIDFLSAFHLVEHLQFPVLIQLLREALRVLKPGGGLLLETPNPESLIVGAYKFWFDPTHVRPYPPELLSQVLETLTFRDIQILRLHPDGRNQEYKLYGVPEPVADLIAGPLDYAILCRRT